FGRPQVSPNCPGLVGPKETSGRGGWHGRETVPQPRLVSARLPTDTRYADLSDHGPDQWGTFWDHQKGEEPPSQHELLTTLLLGDGQHPTQPPLVFAPRQVRADDLEHPPIAFRDGKLKPVSQGIEVTAVRPKYIAKLLFPAQQAAQFGDGHSQAGPAVESVDG